MGHPSPARVTVRPTTLVQPAHYAFYLLGFLPTQVPVAHLLAARPIQQNGSQFFAYSVGVSLRGFLFSIAEECALDSPIVSGRPR